MPSRVKLGRDMDTFETVALKILDRTESGERSFAAELDMYRRLPEHRCVPKLHGHAQTKYKNYIVLEYLPFPTLSVHLESNAVLTEEACAFILRQLVDAVHYITHRRAAHRDLKCANIIINPDTLALKLIDFGLGTLLDDDDAEDTRDSSYRGTPINMAPEILAQKGSFRVVAAELWSLGVIFLQCLSGGAHPFEDAVSKRDLRAQQVNVQSVYAERSPQAKEILNGLLAMSPRRRLTLAGLQETLDRVYPAHKTPRRVSPRDYVLSHTKSFVDLRDWIATNGSPPTSPARHR